MTPLLSVGMVVRNCECTVEEAVSSILGQTFRDFELILIDDSSSDGTIAILQEISDPRLRLIRHYRETTHYDLAARLNQAVSLARGKYFARMDGDDVSFDYRFAHQIKFLESHPEVDLLASAVTVFDGRKMSNRQHFTIGIRPIPSTHAEICARPWKGFPMAHPTWMGKTEWFRSNPYREDCIGMEDKDLLFRTYKFSRFAGINTPLLAYREESLSLKKILTARVQFAKTLWRSRDPKMLTLGVAGQTAAAIRDLVAIGSGLNYKLLRHRAQPMSSDSAPVLTR